MSTPIVRRRKLPVEVDTIQWLGDNLDDLIDFTGGGFSRVDPDDGSYAPDVTAEVYDELHDSWIGVKTGQHIVRGVKRELYPIAEDVLAETYEEIGRNTEAPQSGSARRQIVAALSEDSLGGIATLQDVDRAEQLVDAHRAEVLAADGQAYDGELAMLRGLVRVLRVVARQDDLAEVQRLLIEHVRDETAARAEENATPQGGDRG
jgi:hypothetical protein